MTFDDMTPEEQLDNVRRWKGYYKADRNAANDEIEKLEAINAELLEACKVALRTINLNDETLTARYALEAALAKARCDEGQMHRQRH